MIDLKKQFNNLMEKIYLKIELVDGRILMISCLIRLSVSFVVSKRVKVELEKVKFQFVKKEIEIKKEQFEKNVIVRSFRIREDGSSS